MQSHTRLSTTVLAAQRKIEKVVLGFDRISFSVDHPVPKLPIEAIERHCKKLILAENRSRPYQPLWQSRVEIFQPSQRACRLLTDAIEDGHYRTRPYYAEIALDFITATGRDAKDVHDFCLAHLLVPQARSKVVCDSDTTFYYHRRTNSQGHKTPHVVALYCDKPSKLFGANLGDPCCHLEHRFSGSDALTSIGIACASDFAAFSHEAFWRDHMKLAELPTKTALGRHLVLDANEPSGTALRKRAEKFLGPFHVQGSFVLQNLRLTHPELEGLLRRLENSALLGHL